MQLSPHYFLKQKLCIKTSSHITKDHMHWACWSPCRWWCCKRPWRWGWCQGWGRQQARAWPRWAWMCQGRRTHYSCPSTLTCTPCCPAPWPQGLLIHPHKGLFRFVFLSLVFWHACISLLLKEKQGIKHSCLLDDWWFVALQFAMRRDANTNTHLKYGRILWLISVFLFLSL